jgi:Kdo2-lipid IVA lauroyltransferase/acyltransferase
MSPNVPPTRERRQKTHVPRNEVLDAVVYAAAAVGVRVVQVLPIRLVARIGRFGGGIAGLLNTRSKRVALENVRRCLPELNERERAELVREHFRRLGENNACALATAGMTEDQLAAHLEIVGTERLPKGAVVAIGHFGNFELYTHIAARVPGARGAATYRALNQPRLDALVGKLRRKSGVLFFNRRREMKALLRTLRDRDVILGLLADQNAGGKGVELPFMGHLCSTNLAPVVLAQRFNLPLFTAVCYRTGLARWRIEVGEEIPTRTESGRRTAGDVMKDVNVEFERAVRRDPPNWFWVHDRWRFVKRQRRSAPGAFNRPATQGS